MRSTARILFIFLYFTITCFIDAQITIDGTVTDSDLNPISSALVEIIDEADTSNRFNDVTNASGNFSISNITDIPSISTTPPKDHIILRNYPNPFNPSTVIYFELPKAEKIEIKIYDILGRVVRLLHNNYHKAGTYQVIWDGRNNFGSGVSAGIYFCRLKTEDQFKVHKMVLLDGGSKAASISSTTAKKSNFQKLPKIDNEFNFTIKVSGNSILASDFKCLTCSGDTTLNLMVPIILKTATIGPEGGILETVDFSLIVPGGAFASNEILAIAESIYEDPFSTERVSKQFSIDGLPDDYSQSLQVKIKHNGDLYDESFVIIGNEGMSPEDGKLEIVYDFISVNDSSGYFKCDLPLNSEDTIIATNNFVSKTSREKKRILVKAVSKYFTSLNDITIDSKFYEYKIYLPSSNKSFEPNIIEYFENAFQLCGEGLFLFPLYPPPSIYIANLSEDIYCQFVYRNSSGEKKAKGLIAVNSKHLDDHDKMKINIGKEVLRFMLFGYDPTYPQMVDPSQELHYWLKQALITWFEKIISGDFEHIPEEFIGNETTPLNGMQAGINIGNEGAVINAKNHGSGMAAFFEFLKQNSYWLGVNAPFFFYYIFSEIKKGVHPVEALQKFLIPNSNDVSGNGLSLVWFDFLTSYVQNRVNDEIFYVDHDIFINSITDKEIFNINNSSDSLEEFSYPYKDLSGKLFRINVNDAQTKESGSLIFDLQKSSIDKKDVKLTIFGVRSNSLDFINTLDNIDEHQSIIINNLHEYDPIVALVTNGKYEAPYMGDSNIQLDVRINNSRFKHCDVRLSVIGIVDTNRYQWSPGWYTDGHFIDDVYYGTINKERQGGDVTGAIEIKVDNEFKIISLDVMAYTSVEGGSSEWGFSAANIQPTENEPYLAVYTYYGDAVCGYVKSIYAYYEYPDGSSTEIRNFECEEENLIHIKFHNFD